MTDLSVLTARRTAAWEAALARWEAYELAHPGVRGWWWFPGMARGADRGYRRDEARAAVGPGWEALADEAWSIVTAAGGRVNQ